MYVNSIKKDRNRIEYDYEIRGDWERYFNMQEKFQVEYDDIGLELIPDSLAVLPLLGNVIIMAALFSAEVFVDSIDRAFWGALPKILDGYQKMYPHIKFSKDVLHTKNIESNEDTFDGGNMLFFSGGVDAYSSLISHEEEDLSLITVWGADIPLDNEKAWKKAYGENCLVAQKHGMPLYSIKANLHTFINEANLNEWSYRNAKDNWWYSFQHSIGMMLLAAPLVYCKNIAYIYFAATYCEKDKKGYALASDPSIDNNIKFSNCAVVHDGFEYSRQDKVRKLCKYAKENKKIKLRVCFKSSEGENCCICRKCLLTIFEILLENGIPEEFGFSYDKENFPRMLVAGMQELAHEHPYDFKSLFADMQIKFREKYRLEEIPNELRAFYILSIDDMISFMSVPNNLAEELKKQITMLNNQVSDLKKWIGELENGKRWLENHAEDMENYIKELVEGKEWLEQQYMLLTKVSQ